MRYDDEDGFESDVFTASTGALEGKYKGVLGASTAQTVRRPNSEARLATRRENLIIRCDNWSL
jgi:putative transposase